MELTDVACITIVTIVKSWKMPTIYSKTIKELRRRQKEGHLGCHLETIFDIFES